MTTLRPTLHRPRIRPLAFAAASVAIVAVTYLAVALGPQRGPTTPTAPIAAHDEVVSQPAPALASGSEALLAALDHEIGLWAASLAANEGDYIAATRLGGLHLQRARITGDLGDYERALDASERAVEADPIFWAGHTLRATVLFALHDFAGALAEAQTTFAADPTQLDALAVDRRREPRARRRPGCGRRLRRARSTPLRSPPVWSRLSHLAFLRGYTRGGPRWREARGGSGRASRGSRRCRLLSLPAGRAPSLARQLAGRVRGVQGLARRTRRVRAGAGGPRQRPRGPGPPRPRRSGCSSRPRTPDPNLRSLPPSATSTRWRETRHARRSSTRSSSGSAPSPARQAGSTTASSSSSPPITIAASTWPSPLPRLPSSGGRTSMGTTRMPGPCWPRAGSTMHRRRSRRRSPSARPDPRIAYHAGMIAAASGQDPEARELLERAVAGACRAPAAPGPARQRRPGSPRRRGGAARRPMPHVL